MAILQIFILVVLGGSAIGCLFGIYRTIGKLSDAVFSVRLELTRLNSKLEKIEVAEPDRFFEAAIRDLEQLAGPRG